MTCYCSPSQGIKQEKQRKGKNVSSRLWVPIEQKSCVCSALWILTQITLPTPPRMKTKVREWVWFSVGHLRKHHRSPMNDCCMHSPMRRDSRTDRWDMSARISRPLLGCRVTSSCSECRWPGVTPGHPLLSTGSMWTRLPSENPAVDTSSGVEGNPCPSKFRSAEEPLCLIDSQFLSFVFEKITKTGVLLSDRLCRSCEFGDERNNKHCMAKVRRLQHNSEWK